jgi:uncharacterized protein with HEPN domain
MTAPDDLIRLCHLADAAAKAIEFCQGRTRVDLDGDEVLVLAVTKLDEIVGEPAKQVSPEDKAVLSEIPWLP